MEEKSRVILYEDLRKQISNIDNYSFSRTSSSSTSSSEQGMESFVAKAAETNEKGIRRNTLTLSIEELLNDNRKYDSHAQEKEMRKKYQNMRKEGKHNKPSLSVLLIWISVSLVVLAFVAFIICVLLEVF